MLIFSGSSNQALAQNIAKELDSELSPLEIFVFPDEEKRITIKQRVVGETVLIIQSTNQPADANYMELFLLVDAIKRSGAEFIKVLMPYMGYQRQDHIFRDGEGVSLEVIANILQKVGVSEFYSFDLHSIKIPEIFTIPAYNLSALSIFAQKIKKDFSKDEIVLVTPDMGGIRRVKQLAEMLNISYATIVKDRDLDSGDIHDVSLEGEVNGKKVLMIDDMISTGSTLVKGADLLLTKGAIEVFAFATHAVLSGNASMVLEKSKIKKIYTTDTINIPKEKQFPKLRILSIATIAADIFKNA